MSNQPKQRGVALILTLILLMVLSVMAVSLLFLSQTETWSSLNYRLTQQSRDAAEAGINAAANFILYSYTPPSTTGPDPLSNYVTTGSAAALAVQYNNADVNLSADSSVSSNYPLASAQNSFNSAGQGSLTFGNTSVNYTSSAKLLSMRQVIPYGSTTPTTIQTWQITADGTTSGIRSSQVEVSAILEKQATPVFTYAAFATNNGCSALTFGGGGTTDSYDSAALVGGAAVIQNSDGNIGTNGNLSTAGSPTTIYGSLSTPRSGTGTCSTNNVTAWTSSNGTVTGGIRELPQPVTYTMPIIPPPGATNQSISNTVTLAPGSYGDISLSGHGELHLQPGIYNINTIREGGANTSIIVDPIPGSSPPAYAPVILNVTGNGGGTVVDLTGNSVQNPSLNPLNFQILYAGSGTVSLKGNTQAAGLVYAPNASFSFAGGSNWYGAVIGAALTDMGGAHIHYDRQLEKTTNFVGNYMLSSFSWKKF